VSTLLVYDWRSQCGDCSATILQGPSAQRCPHCGATFETIREVATLQYPRSEYRASFLNVRRHRFDLGDLFFALVLVVCAVVLWQLA
jgi:hypothetical protein